MEADRLLLAAFSLLLAGLVAAATRFYFSWRRRDQWIRRNVPFVPSPLLQGGVVGAIAAPQRHRIVQAWSRQYGLVFGYRFLWNHTIVVSDPAMAAQLLGPSGWTRQGLDKSRVNLYSRLDYLWDEAAAHGSLFTLPTGPHHKAIRRAVAPAFSTDNLRKGFPAVVEIAGQLAAALEGAGPNAAVEIDAAMKRESLDVIGRVGFGTDFGASRSLEGTGGMAAIFDLVQDAIAEGMARVVDPFRERTAWFRKDVRRGMARCDAFRAFMTKLVREVKARGPPADDDVSIAAYLLRAKDPDTGRSLSETCLVAEFSIVLIAGVDTTSHTLAFFLYLVSQHPETKARIAAELDSLGLLARPGAPPPRPLEWGDLPKLTYLGCAIKEAMRLVPVAGEGTFRVSERDVQLGDLTIPAGVFIWAFFLGTFTHPELWDDPDDFRPERWLDPECEYVQPGGDAAGSSDGGAAGGGKGGFPTDEAGARLRRFYPFSQGQRGCVGRALAVMNYTVTAATLLGRFTFRLADEMGGSSGVRAAEAGNLTIQTKDGLRMHCVSRAALD